MVRLLLGNFLVSQLVAGAPLPTVRSLGSEVNMEARKVDPLPIKNRDEDLFVRESDEDLFVRKTDEDLFVRESDKDLFVRESDEDLFVKRSE